MTWAAAGRDEDCVDIVKCQGGDPFDNAFIAIEILAVATQKIDAIAE